jgi:tetratricopeptide (TPR) repeat protein
MFNSVLWTLDNEMDGGRFERLCTDLLAREGYKDIVPIGGTYDRGRDAEVRRWKGIKATGGVTFFQYSLEKNWRSKLKKELKKVYKNDHIINFYVFITCQRVTGHSRNEFAKFVEQTYGWQLIVYDREWLRHRLEEEHPDLATKYLGISETNKLRDYKSELRPLVPLRNQKEKAWQLYLQKDYERAAVEFKEFLDKDRRNVQVWQALAWCQYTLFRYGEALVSINRALALEQDNDYSLGLKASILTEDGIERGVRANLLLARNIFKQIADKSNHWIDYYNYGNVLDALHDYTGAKQEFLKAIDKNPQQPEVWKNLGSVYYHLQDHEKEIECYNRALEINNRLPQALISKGVTLLRIFRKAREAAELMESGLQIEESIGVRWPHAWYWLAQAYYEQGNLPKALERINVGLAMVPSHYGLLNMKAMILSRLWREDPRFIDAALAFFQFRTELLRDDHESLVELARLYKATGQEALLQDLLKGYIDAGAINPLSYLELTNHDFDDFFTSLKYFAAYRTFRESQTVSEYIALMKEQGILCDDDFESAVFVVCSIPFGLACDVFANHSQTERAESLEKAYSILFDSLKTSFPRLSLRLLRNIKLDTPDQIADGLSRIMVVWPDIPLLEFSRQLGYIAAIFGMSAKDLDRSIAGQGKKLSSWQKEIMIDSLSEINDQLKIFKG